jgi:hypothetical protein
MFLTISRTGNTRILAEDNKIIGIKEKNVFKIFANTKIIDFNYTCKIKHEL